MTTTLTSTSRSTVWAGRVVGGLPALFLLIDAVGKLIQPEPVVRITVEMGFPASVIIWLGVVLLASTVLYLIPQTAVLGAILLTGYLGGAVASHVRLLEGWFSILFPVALGAMLWGGLWLRDLTIRTLLPLRS